MFDVNRAFSLLKRISFERTGGSKEELKAARIIKKEIEKENYSATIEEFEVDHSEIIEASLQVTSPSRKKYTVTGVKMSGNTPDKGIEKDFVYVEDVLDANVIDIKDKIVLVNGRMLQKYYTKLIEKKAAGFICFSGSLYDDVENSDLNEMQIREPSYKLGKIPGVCIRISDAQKLVESKPSKVKIVLKQKEGKVKSRNVITKIPGKKYKDEAIVITAHYDSVRFSTGAFDNASGSVGIMELFHHFVKNPPKRNMVFVWCGSEEMGLLGSKAYVNQHKDELSKYVYCLNIDMIGITLGKEIAVSTAEKSLVDYIDYLGKEIGIAVRSRQGVYSSDSTPFADNGIPATSFARISPAGGAEIHSRKDVIDNLSPNAFTSSLTLILEFLTRIDKSLTFPIPKSIPDNMKLELDYYNFRKERPEA